MANPLVPCAGCGRHVRVSESACPFCGASLGNEARAKVIPAANQRMGRNAMFVFATSLALGGCASTTGPGDASGSDVAQSDVAQNEAGPRDDGGPMPLYGGPVPVDGGPVQDSGGGMSDSGAPQDGGGGMALYGGPVPVDAGPNNDGGGVAPLYGGPVPTDSGSDGNPGLRYGAPPPTRDA